MDVMESIYLLLLPEPMLVKSVLLVLPDLLGCPDPKDLEEYLGRVETLEKLERTTDLGHLGLLESAVSPELLDLKGPPETEEKFLTELLPVPRDRLERFAYLFVSSTEF